MYKPGIWIFSVSAYDLSSPSHRKQQLILSVNDCQDLLRKYLKHWQIRSGTRSKLFHQNKFLLDTTLPRNSFHWPEVILHSVGHRYGKLAFKVTFCSQMWGKNNMSALKTASLFYYYKKAFNIPDLKKKRKLF